MAHPIENHTYSAGFHSIIDGNERRAAERPKTGTVRPIEVKLHPKAKYTKPGLHCASCHVDTFFYKVKGKDRHCPHCQVRWTNYDPSYDKKFKPSN